MKLIRVTQATAASLLLTAALAACAGSGDEDTATDTGAPDAQAAPGGAPGQGGPGGPGGQFPGAFGTVAAVSGKTAQVQSEMSGQVAVSWTSGTTFTEEVDAELSDVTVGACVVVSSDDAEPGATEVTATSVRVMDDCDGRGDMPSDMPTDMPTDMPSDLPEGGPGGGGFGGFGTVGEVTAVSSDGFTVSGMEAEVAVIVTGDTTYTTTADATGDAVKTGVCLSAQGETDDTGALTATTISVSQPVDGECSGFGGGFMGRPGGAA